MPKIRGIKPEFWTDEDVVELSIAARLLFIGLWNLACDNGHVPDKPKQIKMRILPADDVNVDKLLNELAENGRLERRDGTVTIANFAKHQRPHRRWWHTCDLPYCTLPDGAQSQPNNRGGKPSNTAPQPLRNGGTPVDNGGATADVDCDGDVDGDIPPAGKPASKRATQLASDWQPSEAHHKLAADRGVDVVEEADKFRDWCKANGATKKDWEAAFRNWLRNARPTGNVRPFPKPDEQGRIALGPLPPRSPWGPA
jgi:hypothetical protein